MMNSVRNRIARRAAADEARRVTALRACGASLEGKDRRAKLAARAPRLSVIIPARNEERAIGTTLDRLRAAAVSEVIVVDGDSADRTPEVARSFGATVIRSRAGRGRQMNAGAAAASGDVLLFLHADTSLPLRFDEYICRAFDQGDVCAGAFRLSIDAEGRSFRLIENLVNFRSRVLQMPYGDQAIFVLARVFHEAGGFPDVPIMEDYALVRRLRRMGRIAIVPVTVATSARRWLDRGTWRTTLTNQVCIAAYRLGVPPTRIARWRHRFTPRRVCREAGCQGFG